MSKKLSIIIPCHNEEKNIPLLVPEILSLDISKRYNLEIILVNDFSKDNTWGVIKELASKYNKVKGISFSKNFGHQAALEAGLKCAENSDAVISMDADFQHPPSLLPELVQKWEEGYDIVNTQRNDDEKISAFKRFTSEGFYNFLNKISDTKIDPGSSDFRLIDKKVVKVLNNLTEKDKFYRGLINWVGFKRTSIPFLVGERKFGQSSYTLKKMLRFAQNGILSFSVLPMKLIFSLGVFMFLISFVGFVSVIILRYGFNVQMFTGTSILVLGVLVSNSLMVLIMGILSLYLIKMLGENLNRPTYIIDEIVGN